MTPLISLFLILKIPFSFHGSAGTSAEYKPAMQNTIGIQTYQLQLSPGFTLYNIPFGANVGLYAVKKETLSTNLTYRFYLSFSPQEKIKEKLPMLQAIHFGDFSPSMTPYTLSGTKIRGVGVNLNPFRKVILAVYYGRVLKSVESEDESAFNRRLTAVQFGVGKSGGSRITFNLLSSKDDISSLPDTVTLKPKENAVMSIDFHCRLLKQSLTLCGELAGSAITEDIRDSIVDMSEYGLGEDLYIIFTPRRSSHADVAGNIGVEVKPHKKIGGSIKYFYIGPGFNSFGISCIRNDNQGYSTGLKIAWAKNFSSQIDYTHESNNLAQSKSTTAIKDKLSANSSLRMRNTWLKYRFYYYRNRTSRVTERVNHEVRISQKLAKNLSASTGIQYNIAKENTIRWVGGIETCLFGDVNLRLKYSHSKTTKNASVAVSYKVLENKLNLSPSYGWTEQNREKSHKFGVGVDFSPAKVVAVNLDISSTSREGEPAQLWLKLGAQVKF